MNRSMPPSFPSVGGMSNNFDIMQQQRQQQMQQQPYYGQPQGQQPYYGRQHQHPAPANTAVDGAEQPAVLDSI